MGDMGVNGNGVNGNGANGNGANGNGDWKSSRPVSLEAVLRPYVVKKAMNDVRPYDVFHPSGWGVCIRQTAYEYYNYKQQFLLKSPLDIESRSERIFDNGDYVHLRWQSYLDDVGVLRGYWRCKNPLCGKVYGEGERLGVFNPAHAPGWSCQCGCKETEYRELAVRSPPEFNFSGHCDAVVDLSHTEFKRGVFDIFVVDFKSIKDSNYSALTGPDHKHVIQVQIYMWLLGLDAGLVVYENKDCQAVRECFVPRSESVIGTIKSESLALMDLLAKNQIPKRPAGTTASREPCRWCKYSQFCYR